MAKDRSKELQENIEKYGDGIDISVLNHFAIIDMEAPLLDDIFDQVHTLRSTINKITELIDDVEYLHNAMLVPQIIDGTKEKLEEKMTEIKSLGHYIRMKIKQLKEIHELKNSTQEKNARQRIIELQIDGITKHFCTIMDRYFQSVIIHRKRCVERIQRQYQSSNIDKTDDEIEEILQNGRHTMYPEIIIETEQAKQNLDIMELRQQELIELENSIRELHDMFFDVAHLIEFQSIQVGTIAEKVSDTAANVDKFRKCLSAEKVPHCFDFKLAKRRFISLLPRLFRSCI